MTVPHGGDVEDFLEQVSEVSILVEGLSKGTISAEYVDRKLGAKADKPKQSSNGPTSAPRLPGPPTAPSAATATAAASVDSEAEVKKAEEEAERKERLMEKATALKHNYERKLKARKRFEEYTAEQNQAKAVGTDYTRWDMWCPSDEEDELINSIMPNSSAFKALEKDIDERHNKMLEQRQLAERMRVKGNEAFKDLQYGEALRCYQEGLSSEKTNMALHSNAAMAALKLQCYVQAIEHCDKALNIADFLHNNLKDALCTKAYQRRATAYRALQQYSQAVQDLELACKNDPESKEIQQQLAKARAELEEYRKQKQVTKALKKHDRMQQGAASEGSKKTVAEKKAAGLSNEGEAGKEGDAAGGGDRLDVDRLRRVEQLVQLMVQHRQRQEGQAQGGAPRGPSEPHIGVKRGPQLPARPAKAGADAKGGKPAAEGATASPDSIVACCDELVKLIDGDDFACLYLRECGGLQAAAQVVTSGTQAKPSLSQQHQQQQQQQQQAGTGSSQASATACFTLLNAACANDANLLLLPSLGVLPAAVQALGGSDSAAAEAALRMLCTAATCEDVRKRLSPLLGTDAGLRSMFRLLGSAGDHTRVVALAVLGNCMVDSGTREAMLKLLTPPASQQQQQAAEAAATASVGPCLVALLRSRSLAVQEKALTLCGNMCGQEALRGALAAQKGLVEAAASALLAPPTATTGSEAQQQQRQLQVAAVQQAAAAMLYNLSLDPVAQKLLLDRTANGSQADQLLALMQCPARDMRLAAHIAGIIARCFKHPQRPRQLPGSCHLEQLLSLLRRCSDGLAGGSDCTAASSSANSTTRPSTASGSKSSPAAAALSEDSPSAAAADPVVRCLTLLTQDEGSDGTSACEQLLKLSGAEVLLKCIKQLQVRPTDSSGTGVSKKTRESLLGNTALCLGHLARSTTALPVLHGLDAVQPLVGVAYEGKGSTSSKNAAIALARMAKHPQMLERLRELHGIEIIYQYVRP